MKSSLDVAVLPPILNQFLDMTGLAWLFIGAVCCPLVLADVVLVENDQDNSDFALKWLRTYGYLHPTGELTVESAEAAVLRMQNFLSLPETGKVDEETLRVMNMPRCGVPDFEPGEDYKKSKRFTPRTPWRSKQLTYKILNYTPDMSSHDITRNFDAAFYQWENACGLSFSKKTSGDATILMGFTPDYNHGDTPFKDEQLAHAFYPSNDPIGGDVHFNDAVLFRSSGEATTGNYDLHLVTLHEIGHSIGLDHSQDPNAIMAPTYDQRYANKAWLQVDDIAGARALYGK